MSAGQHVGPWLPKAWFESRASHFFHKANERVRVDGCIMRLDGDRARDMIQSPADGSSSDASVDGANN